MQSLHAEIGDVTGKCYDQRIVANYLLIDGGEPTNSLEIHRKRGIKMSMNGLSIFKLNICTH